VPGDGGHELGAVERVEERSIGGPHGRRSRGSSQQAISPKNSLGPSVRSGRPARPHLVDGRRRRVLDYLETTSLGRLPTLAEDDVGVTVPSAPPR
jgi:hypothetical protein